MKNLYRATALAAAMSVAACVAQPSKSSEPTLKDLAAAFEKTYSSSLCVVSSKCEVIVTVKEGCRITVNPYTIGIPEPFGAVDITWRIDTTNSYGNVEFTKDGINFKSPGSNQEFDDPRPTGNAFKWKDKNPHDAGNPKRPFHYNVKVTQGGVTCPTYDPTVVNDY